MWYRWRSNDWARGEGAACDELGEHVIAQLILGGAAVEAGDGAEDPQEEDELARELSDTEELFADQPLAAAEPGPKKAVVLMGIEVVGGRA